MKQAIAAVALSCGLAGGLALPLSSANAKPVVEVAFVLDTTGSMSRLIEGAKRKIWSIATSILDCSPDAEIRMGIVAYRDIGDDYVTKVFPLTSDIQDLYSKLLELRAAGGGDWPESVNEALEIGVAKMPWTQGGDVTRIIFLVGDAPPHMDYKQDTKYPDVVKIALSRGITINAVQAGNARDTERVWREIAQLGKGDYIPIPQDGGQIVIIETPYDTEIIELQKRINHTVVPYGTHTEQLRVQQKTELAAAAPVATSSDMAGYMNKRASSGGSAEAITGNGDLVADVTSGRQKLDALKDDELPETFRKLDAPSRKAFLDQQLAERKTLNEKLAALVKQRDGYVVAERKKAPAKTTDSFDRAVEASVQRQIKK
jgi:hypothetical protein